MEPFEFCDALGPEKVIEIHEPRLNLRAFLVVDNTACGPAIGGTRMAPDATRAECFRLARAMTLKNAAAGLRHGGAKSVIVADPGMPPAGKEALIRAFARAIDDIRDYIPGPDMGTDERAMAWVHDEIGRAAGLPKALGGIPLDEIGATGYGLAVAAGIAAPCANIALKGARIVVQGFGAVGRHAARFLVAGGAVLVAASDSHGTVADPSGLDLAALTALKAAGRSVIDYPKGRKLSAADVVGVDCDIWIPAARPDVINRDNVDALKTRLVLQGANIPITAEAERRLHDRGVLSIPDFIANAGGVIAAAVEYQGGSEAQALAAIAEKIGANTREVLEAAAASGGLPRDAAVAIARNRVETAMSFRR